MASAAHSWSSVSSRLDCRALYAAQRHEDGHVRRDGAAPLHAPERRPGQEEDRSRLAEPAPGAGVVEDRVRRLGEAQEPLPLADGPLAQVETGHLGAGRQQQLADCGRGVLRRERGGRQGEGEGGDHEDASKSGRHPNLPMDPGSVGGIRRGTCRGRGG